MNKFSQINSNIINLTNDLKNVLLGNEIIDNDLKQTYHNFKNKFFEKLYLGFFGSYYKINMNGKYVEVKGKYNKTIKQIKKFSDNFQIKKINNGYEDKYYKKNENGIIKRVSKKIYNDNFINDLTFFKEKKIKNIKQYIFENKIVEKEKFFKLFKKNAKKYVIVDDLNKYTLLTSGIFNEKKIKNFLSNSNDFYFNYIFSNDFDKYYLWTLHHSE